MTTGAVAGPRILVSTDNVEDGHQIARLLQDEFANVQVSSQPESAAADFEACLPDVLVLAFDKLERAQRYYLGLYRLGRSVHAHPHRTVLLCSKDEVRAAYELCKKDFFDDYVLHWPHAQDGRRLLMSVWIACREQSAKERSGPPRSEWRAHARHLRNLDRGPERDLAGGEQHREQVEPSRAGTRPVAAKAAGQRFLLLAVDDERLTWQLLSGALDREAYEIHFASDASEALALLRRLRPDAILMDIRLPGIDGMSLTERLKASPALAGIPIIMMSGDSRVETLARSVEAGAAAFIVKPFTRETLTANLQKVLQG